MYQAKPRCEIRRRAITIATAIWSHFTTSKIYTAINIGGLAIGIGCSLVIYKIIAYESSFDSYHTNNKNIYRLITEYQDPIEGIKYEEGQVPPVGEAIRNEFPGIDASLYEEEKNTSNLIQLFVIIAILIGSLGLYGLITHIISQKTKEISIRKVNGAKVSEILALLNKDFMIYFALAFIMACPIAYITMDKWLQNFAYKTELSWWIFALAGIVVMVISFSTVSGQTFTAARRNPVDAFRHE